MRDSISQRFLCPFDTCMSGVRLVIGILVTVFSPLILLFFSLVTARHMLQNQQRIICQCLVKQGCAWKGFCFCCKNGMSISCANIGIPSSTIENCPIALASHLILGIVGCHQDDFPNISLCCYLPGLCAREGCLPALRGAVPGLHQGVGVLGATGETGEAG